MPHDPKSTFYVLYIFQKMIDSIGKCIDSIGHKLLELFNEIVFYFKLDHVGLHVAPLDPIGIISL